jgi:hypothetical protein
MYLNPEQERRMLTLCAEGSALCEDLAMGRLRGEAARKAQDRVAAIDAEIETITPSGIIADEADALV